MKAAIEVRHVVKRYGDLTALNDVSFTIGRANFLVCWGPMGRARPR